MSKSFKKPIIKDSPRNYKKSTAYWRIIRRVIKNNLNQHYIGVNNTLDNFDVDEPELKNPKQIINDYDYSDYTFILNKHDDETKLKKYSRK